jgi:hypothetical protein
MLSMADYRRFARECRRLAAMLTEPADKQALELMAIGWDKTAERREAMRGHEQLKRLAKANGC